MHYPPPENSVEIPSSALANLTIAILTTIISYQLTALTTDVVLGWKPRKVARIDAFQSLLLSRKGSPIAILNALLRTDLLTRIYFQGNLPARSIINRDHEKIRPKAVFLLLTLLFTAPLVNILVFIMTIENSQVLTFRDARFPNVSFGAFDKASPWRPVETISESFGVVPIDYHPQDSPLSRFLLYSQIHGPIIFNPNAFYPNRRKIRIVIVNYANITLKIAVEAGHTSMEGHIFGKLKTPTKFSNLRMNVTRDDAKRMALYAVEMMPAVCGRNQSVKDMSRDKGGIIEPHLQEILIDYRITTCPEPDLSTRLHREFGDMIRKISKFITLTNATSLDVKPTTATTRIEDFEDGSSEVFLLRRKKLVGIPFMAIFAGIAVVARLMAVVLLDNDVNDGIERILKERVGLPHCASLLQEGETVIIYNAPRKDAEGGELHPLWLRGAWSSFLLARLGKTPSTSQRTLVMFARMSHRNTDRNRPGRSSPKDNGTDTDGDLA